MRIRTRLPVSSRILGRLKGFLDSGYSLTQPHPNLTKGNHPTTTNTHPPSTLNFSPTARQSRTTKLGTQTQINLLITVG